MTIKIGKFTLETLTTGMYDSPKDIYREYIQNAVDSIDNAIKLGVLKINKDLIEIKIDKSSSSICITDNGTGISVENAKKYLLNVGDSVKFNSDNRGFRGIGRLAGLAYCDELIFCTSCYGEESKTIIKFDAEQLRKSLYSIDNNDTLEEVFTKVISISHEYEAKGKHYFSVVLTGVTNAEEILDDMEVYNYLSQVAPVPFAPEFKWKDIIRSKLAYLGLNIGEYNITLEGEHVSRPIYKGYSDHFIADRVRKEEDAIEDIEEKIFHDERGNVIAVLWYAKSKYSGTIQNELIKGVRLRKGNIQLGSRITLNSFFKDERFNGWLIGELHITSDSLIPNARRDNLEKTKTYYDLQGHLRSWADEISSEIRKISIKRNTDRTNKKIEAVIEGGPSMDALQDVEIIPEIQMSERQEYDDVAHAELINQLDLLIEQKRSCTKYKALNIQGGITIEEKKVLETVLDIITEKYSDRADNLVSTIIKEYKTRSMANK